MGLGLTGGLTVYGKWGRSEERGARSEERGARSEERSDG